MKHAREVALRVARERLKARRQSSPAQVMASQHEGSEHLNHFRSELAPLIPALPPNFRALEIGAGAALHAALFAAHGAGTVLATEIAWAHSPRWEGNAHTLHRLAQREPALKDLLEFEPDPQGHLTGVRFTHGMHLVQADAGALPARSGALDLVYSINCLEHVPSPRALFRECARALRQGGVMYHATQPLFFSAFGHHLADIFPLPWGHLLWPAEELAALVVREAGAGREWSRGEPLRESHLLEILNHGLNRVTPAQIRAALREGPWRIAGWMDVTDPSGVEIAREMELVRALRGISEESLFLAGLRMRLTRESRVHGLRLPFILSFHVRRRLRSMIKRNCS